MPNTLHRALLHRARTLLRTQRYSEPTQKAYLGCIRRYLEASGAKSTSALSPEHGVAYVNHIVRDRRVSAATQNQTLAALSFLYAHVLGADPVQLERIPRAPRRRATPVGLSRAEVGALLSKLSGVHRLMGGLLYGSGLRLLECCRLRVRDLDFDGRTIAVRASSGLTDRKTPLPASMIPELKAQITLVRRQHGKDVNRGAGGAVIAPPRTGGVPRVSFELEWQWLFPAKRLVRDAWTGDLVRPHRHESGLQRAVKQAAAKAGLKQPATCHSLRHSFAIHLLEAGYDVEVVQRLLGHRDSSSTLCYVEAAGHRPGSGFYGDSGGAGGGLLYTASAAEPAR